VRRAPVRGELLLGAAAGLGGFLAIVSALTPEFANRYDLVQGVLPPGVPVAARVLALSFGLGLVWISRLLARRRRRAWQLAVALVVGVSLAHVAKGLDFEEALLSLFLLVALLRFRKRFDVPGDPRSVRPLLATAAALTALGTLAVVLDYRGLEGDRWDDILVGVTIVLVAHTLYLWLRPISERVKQSAEERRVVSRLVRSHGNDSLAFFSLRRDKNYFLSTTRRSFLAYRVLAGTALVSGGPIGAKEEFADLLAEFRRVCQARGWRLALLSVDEDVLPLARGIGLRPIKIGDEAVVRPSSFSLEGRSVRKVRQSVARLERAGYTVDLVNACDVDGELRAELERVSAVWRGERRTRLFDGDGRSISRARDGVCGCTLRRARRRLPPSRSELAWLFTRRDAPRPRNAERPDGVPDRSRRRMGTHARRRGGIAQLLRLRGSTRRTSRAVAVGGSNRPACGRPRLPARTPPRLQPEVHAGVAAALPLRRAAP
jgi:lysyl-tRNA synthetase class 2